VPSLPVGRPIMLKLFGLHPSSHCGEVSRRMASPEKKRRLMSVPNFAEFLYAPNTAGHIDEASAVRLNNTTCETRMAWLIQKSCTRSINRYQKIYINHVQSFLYTGGEALATHVSMKNLP